MKNITVLPPEVIGFTYEHHFQRMNTRSRSIYLAVLIFFAASITALFFVSVNVIVKGTGMLTAAGERSWIKSPASGKVAAVFVKENQAVKAGEILFTMESAVLEEEFSYLRQRKRTIERRIADVRKLTALCNERNLAKHPSLHSSLYLQEYTLLKQKVAGAEDQLQNALRILKRNEYLFESGVLSAAEFDKFTYAAEKARSELALTYEEQGSRWQTALNELSLEQQQLMSAENKFREEKELYTVRASIDGILQQLEGLMPGSYFSQGERVARISPDSGLLARISVSPREIGLLRDGMPVRLQIDAFNYQQWGMVTGTVSAISGDVLLTQGRAPFFEVKCGLEKTTLKLENGYSGELKRGMSLQARFLVTERTLFQLLYDNIDDWLDPYAQNKG